MLRDKQRAATPTIRSRAAVPACCNTTTIPSPRSSGLLSSGATRPGIPPSSTRGRPGCAAGRSAAPGHLKAIWLTHAHIVHAGGTGELAQRLQLPSWARMGRWYWIDGLAQQRRHVRLCAGAALPPTRWLHDSDTVTIGHEDVERAPLPRIPGHVNCSTRPQIDRAFVGDDALPAASAHRAFRAATTNS